MKVKDLMSKKPAYSTPEDNLNKVAKQMAENNVGMIPIVDNKDNMTIVGVVTDRDIAVRCVAVGRNPAEMRAAEVMSKPVVTVREEDSAEDVARMMEKNMIRRIPVVDAQGKICGIVAQADIALKTSDKTTADVVQSVSKPTEKSSKVH